MANWASVSYRIEGNKNDLQKVFGVIDDFMTGRKKPVDEFVSKSWEGNILKALGATDEQMAKGSLRGFIETYEMEKYTISIEAEEAWKQTDFRDILLSLMPDLTIFYMVEEPGFGIYVTNDRVGRYFNKLFYVDTCIGGNYTSERFEMEEQAIDYVATLLEKEEVSDEDIKEWNESHKEDCDFIYMHEFEIED